MPPCLRTTDEVPVAAAKGLIAQALCSGNASPPPQRTKTCLKLAMNRKKNIPHYFEVVFPQTNVGQVQKGLTLPLDYSSITLFETVHHTHCLLACVPLTRFRSLRRGGLSLRHTERRWALMCSVRTAPKTWNSGWGLVELPVSYGAPCPAAKNVSEGTGQARDRGRDRSRS